MTSSMWIASCAWLLLVLGYVNRRNRTRHVPLLLGGILLDFSLVTYLQLTRSAIQTALRFELTALQQAHIAMSSLALVLYLPVLGFGFRLLRGAASQQVRVLHRRIGIAALLARTLGFALMFSMWKE